MKTCFVFCLALFIAGQSPGLLASSDKLIIYTLPVKYRSAEAMVDMIIPLLAPGGHLSQHDNKLIIKTTAANFQEIALLVDELDTPVQNLIISVRQDSSGNSQQSGVNAYGTIRRGTVTVDGRPVEKQKTGDYQGQQTSVTRSTGWGQGQSSYQVKAIEGEPVFIQTGQQIPLQSRYGLLGGTVVQDAYQPVMSGIQVTARLRGDQVLLDLRQQKAEIEGRAIREQSMATQVNARLGEWVPVGGISQQQQQDEQGLGRYESTQDLQDTQIYIKVDKY